MDGTYKLALETISMGKQAIIFVSSRASAEKTAEEISKRTSMQLPELRERVEGAASTATKQCKRLGKCIVKGVAFHHAGLMQKQKDLIEEKFRDGKVKIICATPTLAAGLSLPVFRVIIKSLKRYSGRWGMDWIPVLEYLQMAGRAGRPEFEQYGEAISIAKSEGEKDEIYQTYVLGEPEEIYSKLAVEPVLRTYLLSLIASGIIRDEEGMKEFFAKTFWAAQFKDMAKLELIMDKMLTLLEEWEFVKIVGGSEKSSDFTPAATLGSVENRVLRATPIGRRVSELYLDPYTARHLLDCLQKYTDQGPFALLQMICNTLEMRPLLRVKQKEEGMVQEALVQRYELLLQEEPSAYDLEYHEFVNSVKTSLFFESWIEEKGEDFLLETYGIRPGETRVKITTADWLLYASEELASLVGFRELVGELRRLRIRVKNGVKEEVLPLLKLKGIGRVRARKLFSNGLRDLGALKKVDSTSLAQLLGRKLAQDVKRQLGEKVVEVAPGRRKGQLSINKF